jgi:hypothetical protein
MQHERVGGDPADELSPKSHAWSRTCHPSPPRVVVFHHPGPFSLAEAAGAH